MIKFSIIITCFNREKFISKSIRSSINQFFVGTDRHEIIVVDDNSKDASEKIISDFVPVIKFIKNKKNLGIAGSRNRGIRISKGQYILMLDSDDYISNNFLDIMGRFLDANDNWDAAACDYIKIKKNGKILKRYNCKKNPIACGILFRRKSLLNIGLYNEKISINEEIDLKRRFLAKKLKMGYVELPLYRYVMHDSNITNK
jgi:glycosyltransferase involved in cell wall biosynthesis